MRRVSGIAVALACMGTIPRVPSAQSQPASIVGAWTLNKDKSELPATGDQSGREGSGRFGGRGGGRRGGGGGGGFRGGFGGGGGFGGNQGARPNPEDMQRRMNALRDIMQPPDRLTITKTDTMVIVTAGDGRTTRLATDGSKVRDDSTGIERRTKWQGDKLVSEVSGAGPGKITETYALDADAHQLTVTLQVDGGNRQSSQQGQNGAASQGPFGTQKRVYDSLAQ